jgi:hypothetical protein
MMYVNHEVLFKTLDTSLAAGVTATFADNDDANSSIPAELRNWLVHLRLLEGVPFANLVADSELLPPESIRWFYLDRRWTDALVQGALSVGTVNSDDRTQLGAAYPAIEEELDNEERNVRRTKGSKRFAGKVDAISGFLLRSRAVAGWPGMHVRAFSKEPAEGDNGQYTDVHPDRMRLLRLERLAPAVLLCLFDGIPATVHIEEPRQGVQFGFRDAPGPGVVAEFSARDKTDFSELPTPNKVTVPFRSGPGSAGVVDIQELERRLAAFPRTGSGDGLDSAEYALQLIRFPWRQVWGQMTLNHLDAVFKPTVQYKTFVAGVHERG